MSNPRPCVCGHLPGDHDDPRWPILGRCRRCISEGHWATGCLAFRPAPRKEPLRARRGRAKVTLRPSSDPGQPWSEGVRVWAWADLPDLRETLASGRMTLDAVWKNGGWHLTWPPEVRDHGSVA